MQQSIAGSNDNPKSIDVYFLPDCPWSKRTLKLLDSFHSKYNSYLITNDEEFKYIFNRTSINISPQIFIMNEFIGGYRELVDLSTSGNIKKLIH